MITANLSAQDERSQNKLSIARSGLSLLSRLTVQLASSATILMFGLSFAPNTAVGGPREVANKIHNRLTGVPPTPQVLAQMEDLVSKGMVAEAARVAMDNPYFYNLSLKNWMVPWSNRDQTPRVPLNDYVATMIGMVRDDVPFDEVLYGDLIYTGKDGLTGVGGAAIPAYSKLDNNHYTALEAGMIDLKDNLVQKQQSTVTGIADTAGVITTRGFGAEFLDAGTNRRALRFTLINFMCNDMEQMMDNTRPDYHIRRDVTRAPGGDPTVFRNKCAGCHTGMDALAGAFSHFDFVGGQVTYNAGSITDKVNRNAQEFPDGWVTRDDSWVNLWTAGANARIGWHGATSGEGVNQLGKMLAATDEFPRCMAKRVFQKVCLRDPKSVDDQKTIKDLGDDFASGGKFSMKGLFADTAAACLND